MPEVKAATATDQPPDWAPVLDAIPAAILLVDDEGTVVYANHEVVRLTGYRPGELRGLPVEALVPDALRSAHARWRAGYQRRPGPRPMGNRPYITCRRADGSTFPAGVSLAPVTMGGVTVVAATVRDETERRDHEERLLRQALHDPLTGLPNRVLFLDRLDHALARAARQGGLVAVLYLDLDGFKGVNDTWGHAVGDEVLRQVARRLAEAVRPGDTVSRFGGDEFLVLCEGLADPDEAAVVAGRLQQALAVPVVHRRGSGAVEASIGIATTGDRFSRSSELVDAADRDMYQLKHARRSRAETKK